jgi:aryl-phospho-beta-D-glucosidase BglC (GH1 family)
MNLLQKKVSCFVLIGMIVLVSNSYPQIPGSPLHVSGSQLFDSINNTFIIKAINLNDYMEHSYNPWGDSLRPRQNFSKVLSWLHTKDDYERIKKMGFNTVRVNICPSHIDSLPDLQRIKQHISWAKNNGLYVILAYFAPPGSSSYKGYYSEWDFYYNDQNKEMFRQHWKRIMKLCVDSNYTNVMYEFLNEPQICYSDTDTPFQYRAYSARNIYKDLMIDLMNSLNSDVNRVVIIDGLSYATADYRGFNYLYQSLEQYKNIVYSFHYYMPDFVDRGCYWKTGDKYVKYSGYSTVNAGFDTVKIAFKVSDLQGEKSPDIDLSPFDQKGKYKIRYFDITDNTDNSTVIKLDLQNQQILEDSGSNYIWDSSNNRKFELGFKGNWNSAVNSSIYMSNNSLVISNTVQQDISAVFGNNYAVLLYHDSTGNNPFVLDESHVYTFKIIIDGDSLSDSGGFTISFKKRDAANTTLFKKDIKNITGNTPASTDVEKILSSYTDRINAAFSIMKDFSNKYSVPVFLGEFGIPVAEREPNTFIYFRNILDNIIKNGFNWAYFDYREPHDNNVILASDQITFGLFSGIDGTSPTATVCKIINGINAGTTSINLGIPYPYYYNKSLIDTLIKTLNGSFNPICNSIDPVNIKKSIPDKYSLEQNYPNPFNPATVITYHLPLECHVKLNIYDLLGRNVITLIDENENSGIYNVKFNGSNLSSGIYFYQLEAGNYSAARKLILIK